MLTSPEKVSEGYRLYRTWDEWYMIADRLRVLAGINRETAKENPRFARVFEQSAVADEARAKKIEDQIGMDG